MGQLITCIHAVTQALKLKFIITDIINLIIEIKFFNIIYSTDQKLIKKRSLIPFYSLYTGVAIISYYNSNSDVILVPRCKSFAELSKGLK